MFSLLLCEDPNTLCSNIVRSFLLTPRRKHFMSVFGVSVVSVEKRPSSSSPVQGSFVKKTGQPPKPSWLRGAPSRTSFRATGGASRDRRRRSLTAGRLCSGKTNHTYGGRVNDMRVGSFAARPCCVRGFFLLFCVFFLFPKSVTFVGFARARVGAVSMPCLWMEVFDASGPVSS